MASRKKLKLPTSWEMIHAFDTGLSEADFDLTEGTAEDPDDVHIRLLCRYIPREDDPDDDDHWELVFEALGTDTLGHPCWIRCDLEDKKDETQLLFDAIRSILKKGRYGDGKA